MKSLKDYSMNLPEQEYHDYPAWSHSLIARYAREGFSSISTLHEPFKPTPAMEFGSLFDSIITRGKATLDEYVVDETVVPPAEKSVFDYLISQGVSGPFEKITDTVLNIAIDNCPTFASKYKKPETRKSKLLEVSQYYEVRRTGKKVVSSEDWNDAVEMARNFRNNDYLNKLFGVKDTKDVEYIYQAQFLSDMVVGDKVVKVKIMPDLLVVNHKEKTVRPVDLKTSGMPAYDWAEQFVKMRYDLEADTYTDVLKKVLEKDEDYQEYIILPYLFTDISRVDKVPVTYEYDPTNGFSFTKNGKTYNYSGWRELLGEIIEYEEQQARVPSYISTEGPNDLISILSK